MGVLKQSRKVSIGSKQTILGPIVLLVHFLNLSANQVKVIITDHDLALINALMSVLLNAYHFSCFWHLQENIKTLWDPWRLNLNLPIPFSAFFDDHGSF